MSEVPPAAARVGDSPRGTLPRVFGRYVLFDQIGRGGMADIYLARADNELGGSRLVVVKQILPELTSNAAFERMFVSEAKLAAELHNANIVQVFDLGREGERLYIGMEYVEGFDLHQLLRELSRAKVPLPSEFAVFMVREVLSALSYAHRFKRGDGEVEGVVHRDVSPSNVLISFEGEVKLCDFGIARALTPEGAVADDTTGAATTRVVGKSAYMAPEQARGEALDGRADVFAAGILLWELCAGRRLYKGSDKEMLELARAAQVPMLPDRGLPAQPSLQKVLDKALARYRDDRFQSAAEMQRALDDYLREARMVTSQLRFGAFLTEHFGERIIETRRERQRAAASYVSETQPAPPPQGAFEEDAPTTIHSPLPPSDPSPREGGTPAGTSGWREPGGLSFSASQTQAPHVEVVEPGAHPPAAGDVEPDEEVEAKLEALSAVDARGGRALPAEARSHGNVPTETRGRLLYVAALLILALGVAAYLWR